ncbi:hypothetical protein CCR94_19600 [Rhodoblastus sphagnicola]|uniref:DUF2628 domain-containing protein n=1 Tax=Rhodoblastus sphagnicola TaxID=333368 RepID=A0A2S6MZA6_9HYPH|nr:DUF2628 domain-containing protein [Rhodoblastus sphagnicola]MBB4198603.1 hypothetical protein [Rhodoblastus sphagnicola]PPQ27676.1 hypothetical protein CCR94_19600 [Rhodoblastus sphagnicola]
MFLYSVYQPAGSRETAGERAVFVRQGFDRTAFLLTPVWALRHRLWRMLGLWLLWTALAGVLALTLHLDAAVAALVYTLGALAFGLEADRVREQALSRKGLLLQGLSLGENARDAERIYFDRIPQMINEQEKRS